MKIKVQNFEMLIEKFWNLLNSVKEDNIDSYMILGLALRYIFPKCHFGKLFPVATISDSYMILGLALRYIFPKCHFGEFFYLPKRQAQDTWHDSEMPFKGKFPFRKYTILSNNTVGYIFLYSYFKRFRGAYTIHLNMENTYFKNLRFYSPKESNFGSLAWAKHSFSYSFVF